MSPAAPPTVLVTRRLFPDIEARIAAQLDARLNADDAVWSKGELIEHLAGCRGVLLTPTERVDAELLDAHPQLRVIANMAVGYNHIDIAACTERGVLVTNTPDVLTETTADFGFALMMAAARRITEGEHFLRAGRWRKSTIDLLAGSDVAGSTLGILGMGRIGQAIARRAALGFRMRVIYHNRSVLDPAVEAQCGHARWVDKDTLLHEADHLIVVVPYSPATHHAIGAAELARMRPGATLTNIARGGVVDDAALAAALRAGRPAAAALDVFEGEPQVHPELLACSNIVLTPHIGSASIATRRAMADLAADNLIAVLQGRAPLTPVNPQVLAPG